MRRLDAVGPASAHLGRLDAAGPACERRRLHPEISACSSGRFLATQGGAMLSGPAATAAEGSAMLSSSAVNVASQSSLLYTYCLGSLQADCSHGRFAHGGKTLQYLPCLLNVRYGCGSLFFQHFEDVHVEASSGPVSESDQSGSPSAVSGNFLNKYLTNDLAQPKIM